MGLTTLYGRTYQAPDEYNLRAKLYSFYVRDRWNLTPKLTIDYGLRWEYFPVPTRSDRGIERYDTDTNKVLVCGVSSVPEDCGISISKRRFAPRVGIAYRATNTLVVRAGYGITNDPFIGTELTRAEFPILTPLVIDVPNSFQPAGRLADASPRSRRRDRQRDHRTSEHLRLRWLSEGLQARLPPILNFCCKGSSAWVLWPRRDTSPRGRSGSSDIWTSMRVR